MDKNALLENLSLTLSAGMDVISSLNSLKEDTKSKKMQNTLDQIVRQIQGGAPLWKALADSKLFPSYVLSLIKIGESSGQLPENLKIVLKEQQKEKALRGKLQSALMYPMFVFSLTFVIGLGIAWFILPNLAKVFTQLRIELPLMTQILITFGLFLGKYGMIVVPLFIVLFASTIYFVFFFPKTRVIGEKIVLQLPIFNKLVKEIELSRMGFLLGTLLNAGITIIESLESLASATSFSTYKNYYNFIHTKVEQGNTLAASLKLNKDTKRLVPTSVIQMISMAEQSGNLPEIFLKINETYEEKTEITTKNLTVLLEPILLIIIWLGVLFVAIAVILPIYSLIGGLN